MNKEAIDTNIEPPREDGVITLQFNGRNIYGYEKSIQIISEGYKS